MFHPPKGENIVGIIGWKMNENLLAFLEEKMFCISPNKEETRWGMNVNNQHS